MLATRYTMLGGRDFDDAIAELLLEQAKTTLDCEVDRTPVVMYKLHSAAAVSYTHLTLPTTLTV